MCGGRPPPTLFFATHHSLASAAPRLNRRPAAPVPPSCSLRGIEAKQARFGLVECLNHGLLSAYPVTYEKEGELVAHVSVCVCGDGGGAHVLCLCGGPGRCARCCVLLASACCSCECAAPPRCGLWRAPTRPPPTRPPSRPHPRPADQGHRAADAQRQRPHHEPPAAAAAERQVVRRRGGPVAAGHQVRGHTRRGASGGRVSSETLGCVDGCGFQGGAGSPRCCPPRASPRHCWPLSTIAAEKQEEEEEEEGGQGGHPHGGVKGRHCVLSGTRAPGRGAAPPQPHPPRARPVHTQPSRPMCALDSFPA